MSPNSLILEKKSAIAVVEEYDRVKVVGYLYRGHHRQTSKYDPKQCRKEGKR